MNELQAKKARQKKLISNLTLDNAILEELLLRRTSLARFRVAKP